MFQFRYKAIFRLQLKKAYTIGNVLNIWNLVYIKIWYINWHVKNVKLILI
jgi:hypothetical protein